MAKVDTTLINEAIIFATKAHSGTVRKGTNIPYVTHPLEALCIASRLTDDQEILSAAALHDVVEDTPFTTNDIEQRFGARVARLVESESEDKMEHLPEADTWQLRKQATLDALEQSTEEEQILVLADKLSNIRCIYHDWKQIGELIWQRFNQKSKEKQEWYYRGIATRLTKIPPHPLLDEFNDLIDIVFGKK